MADHSIPDQIALEIMDTIEREKRINRDDLRMAVERVLQRADQQRHPLGVNWRGKSDYELLCQRMYKRVEQKRIERDQAAQQDMLKRMIAAERAEKMVNPPVFGVGLPPVGGITVDFIAAAEAGSVDMTDNALLPRKDMSALEAANRFGAVGGSSKEVSTAFECFLDAQRRSCE